MSKKTVGDNSGVELDFYEVSNYTIDGWDKRSEEFENYLIQRQFFSKGLATVETLSIAWLILHPGKKIPQPNIIEKFFKAYISERAHLFDFHKKFIASLSNAQILILQDYQKNPGINYLRSTKVQHVEFDASFKIDLSKNSATVPKAAVRKILLGLVDDVTEDIRLNLEEADLYQKGLLRVILKAPRLAESESYTLFRGVGIEDQLRTDRPKAPELFSKKGDILEWDRFSSFSISPILALIFKGKHFPCCIFKMQYTSKVPAVIIPINNEYHQFEVLLPPATYRVVSTQKLTIKSSPTWSLRVVEVEYVSMIE